MVIATLIDRLLSMQNRDGGWPYVSGKSWTEPTALAILALQSARCPIRSLERARSWLKMTQRRDGGWPPTLNIPQSTSVTSAAVLASLKTPGFEEQAHQGLIWILSQTGAHETLLTGILRALFNQPKIPSPLGGAPWYGGTAAWVAPTAMKILALSSKLTEASDESSRSELQKARQFLLSRRLPDGGWNHGGAYAADEIVPSYPETTGLSLLALRGPGAHKLQSSLERAQSFFHNPGSLEAWAWLYMALTVHGLKPSSSQLHFQPWTSRDLALCILALTANQEENRLTGGLHV